MLPTMNSPLNESDLAEAQHISNESAFAEPWSGLNRRPPPGRAHATSRPQLTVPEATRTPTYSERFHPRRQSGSSASPIDSDRRTVVTVEDPLSDSDSAYDKDHDTDNQMSPDEQPARSMENRLLADAGAWADKTESAEKTTVSKSRSSSMPSDICSVSHANRTKEFSILHAVQRDLRSALIPSSVQTNRYFVPYDKLRATLTKSCVHRILSQSPVFEMMSSEMLEMTAKNICTRIRKPNGRRTGYIRIFAILVWINQIQYIEDFLYEDSLDGFITDADLPLRPAPSPPHPRGSNLVLRNSDEDTHDPLRRFESWRPEDMDWFILQQETLISPRLRMRGDQLCLHRLRSNIILPFVECGSEKYDGGFAEVSKIKIHPAHCDFNPTTLPHAVSIYGTGSEQQGNRHVAHDFALKKIHSSDYKLFRAEIGVHEKFSASREGHAHLIRLLAAIEHGQSYYLLFPWAQGTLADLWQRFEASPESPDDIEWLIKQSLGITDGLQRIHRYRSSLDCDDEDRDRSLSQNKGTHGDVKAENILFFDPLQREGLLGNKHIVVSDFGLTRFRKQSQGSRPLAWSRTYRAPELDLHYQTSRKYDVWSLGCLSLEFISWFLLGIDATRPRRNAQEANLRNFQDVRLDDDRPFLAPYKEDKFFNLELAIGGCTVLPVVKPSVIEWINKLRQMKECSEPIKAFLHLIQSQMLVPDMEARGSMLDIRNELKRIHEEFKATRTSFFSQSLDGPIPEHLCVRSEDNDLFKNMDQFNLEPSESVQYSGLSVSETSSAVQDRQMIMAELENIYQENLRHLDADNTAKKRPNDVSQTYSNHTVTLAKVYNAPEQEDITKHDLDGTVGAPVDVAEHQQHNLLAARHHRSNSSPVILFISPTSRGFLPSITATPSSAEVSRKNSLDTSTFVSTVASSRDELCLGISSRLSRGKPHGRQTSEATPLLFSLDESSQRTALQVAPGSVDTRKSVATKDIDARNQSDGGPSWWFHILCGCYSARRGS